MEVVPQAKRLPPIPLQRHDVEEWSTLDSLTGILEHARVQRDHWAATTCNSSHHFGKVIDSRARNLADGSKEQRQQTKQLEVYQASIPGGSVQVIRSQSLTTSSWQGQSTTTKLGSGTSWSARANPISDNKNDETEFDNLKLALNPLDISSQKMKASVVRRGSISSRRPPSRPRSIAGSRSDKPGQIMEEEEVADGINHISRDNNSSNSSKLSQMSRICHQYHQEAKNNHASFQSSLKSSATSSSSTFKQTYLANGTDSLINKDKRSEPLPSPGPVTLSFLLDSKKENSISNSPIKKKPTLDHKKSCSSEDLRLSPETDSLKIDDTETNEDWKRSSKARRSLQFPVQSKSKPSDSNSNIKSVNSVLKVAKEIEARKQIVTNSLKNNQWEDILNHVVIGNTSNQKLEKTDYSDGNNVEDELIIKDNNKVIKKKPSFITVESLKEVRGRLRRLGSPVADEIKGEEEDDDGIVTELKGDSPVDELEDTPKSVRSYVYGMESLLRNNSNRPTTITGTGSLESRSTNKSGSNGSNRTEEWYNRRKSYGFEQVNGQSTTHGSNLNGDKSKVDSSTDSGICRSSETVANVQFLNKPLSSNPEGNCVKTSHTIMIKKDNDKNNTRRESVTKQDVFGTDFTQKGRKTVVTLGVATKNSAWNLNNQNDKTDEQLINTVSDDPKEIVTRGKIADAIRSLREKALETNGFESRRLSEPITISIPVSTLDDSEIVESNGLLLKQTKEPSSIEKFNLSKQFNEDSNQFSTSYSKLLYGTNYTDNDNNIKKPDSTNTNNKSNVHLQISSWNRNNLVKDNEFKRHSIAVDDAKYMDSSNNEQFEIPSIKDKIACFKNQFDSKSNLNDKIVLPQSSVNSSSSDKNKHTVTDNDIDSNTNERKQKKVEFCKTEVHFAAEPGRFNIVETDGKPPSSNLFRRRRRTIAETPARSHLPEIRFGDSQYEKDLLTYCEVNDLETDTSSQQHKAPSPVYRLSPQFIDNDKEEDCIMTQSNTLIPIETDFNEEKDDFNMKINETNTQDYEDRPRSILKHNAQKQHQQHNIHVENIKTDFEENDSTANVTLKSITTTDSKSVPWKSNVRLQQNPLNSEDSESELQKLLKTLRPVPVKQSTVVTSYNSCGTASNVESSATAADNGLAVRISSAMNLPDQRRASWSVAERIRHVEDPKNKGFSTKVNFGSGETTVVTPELRSSPVRDLLSTGWISDSVNTNDTLPPVKKIQHVVTSNVVPTYIGSANKIKSVETLVSTRSGHPKITSISLRYTDDVNNEADKSIGKSQISRNDTDKTSLFKTHTESTHKMKVFKNEPNSSNVAGYSPTDSICVKSKMLTSTPRQDISESENKCKNSHSQLNSPRSEAIYEEIKTKDDPSKLRLSSQVLITKRKTQSPSSDSVFFERSTKHQSVYSQVNTRNKSMSPVPFPTRPVANLPDYANTRQVHLTHKQMVPASVTANDSAVWSSVSVNKTKKREINKKEDVKKKLSDDTIAHKDANKLHKKERHLSTSSSGRDGWLNTPKENAKQRNNNLQPKRLNNVDVKKDKKIVSNSSSSAFKSENSGKMSVRQGSESPIYQNREVYSKKKQEKDPFESLETESAILEELTRAADQILLAVNGYTDEESIRLSSDDEYRKKNGKDRPVSKPLSTISEMPVKKKSTATTALKKESFSKTSGSTAQSSVGTSSRTRLCKTSSNSSVEGNADGKSLLTEERSKRRAARLLQRASSRELLLQNTGASSSEDVASGTETAPQRSKQRVVRRTAKQYSSRTSSHQNSTLASTSRTKDRVQRTGGSTVDEKEPVSHSRRRTEEKSRTNRGSAMSGSGKTSLPPAGVMRCERTSRLVERRPPERSGGGGGGGGAGGGYGGGGGVGRTRNQHALYVRNNRIRTHTRPRPQCPCV